MAFDHSVDGRPLTLRPAKDADRRFVESVYFSTQRYIIETLFGWRGDGVEQQRFAAFYDPANTSIIAVDGNDIGWLTVQRGDDIVLDSLYLAGEWQRQGIGSLLLRRLIAEAEKSHMTVKLSTAKMNPAKRLYERFGFVTLGEDEYKVYMERRHVPISPAQSPSVTVRRRVDADLAPCIMALRDVHDEDRYPSSWPSDAAAWLTPTGVYAAFIATQDDSVVGHVALGPIDEVADPQLAALQRWTAARLVEIKRLFVAPSARGTGIGKALLDAAVRFAETYEFFPVLEVTADRTAAIQLYASSGWMRVGSGLATWRRASGESPLLYQYILGSTIGPAQMEAAWRIRRATVDDAGAIVSLLRDIAAENRRIRTEVPFDAAARTRRIGERLRDGSGVAFLAECSGVSVGQASILPSADRAYLGMGIAAGWRGYGIGRALLAEVEAYARTAGIAQIDLEVYEHNAPARALYDRAGFVECGERSQEQRASGDCWIVIPMCKRLESS